MGLHLKYSSFAWFGSLKGGYNDYCIEAFEKWSGVKVPVDRRDPARGRLYADWLLSNVREKWIRWRCKVCTDFWIEMARKLAKARGDLKLWINNICVLDASMDGFLILSLCLSGCCPTSSTKAHVRIQVLKD